MSVHNLMKKMEETKRSTKLTERKFEELKMALLNISGKNDVFFMILKNRICNLEKERMKKDVINFFGKR